MDTLSLRIPEDVSDRVEAFAEEKGISQSEAGRRLIVSGLTEDETERRLDDIETQLVELETAISELDRDPWWRRLLRGGNSDS